jgi:hypothetical protein
MNGAATYTPLDLFHNSSPGALPGMAAPSASTTVSPISAPITTRRRTATTSPTWPLASPTIPLTPSPRRERRGALISNDVLEVAALGYNALGTRAA